MLLDRGMTLLVGFRIASKKVTIVTRGFPGPMNVYNVRPKSPIKSARAAIKSASKRMVK
jgi:hypothetical protein